MTDSNPRITREDLVEQSVTDYVRHGLYVDRAYPEDQVEIIESFTGRPLELTRTLIALGFNFDDGGEAAEMGSDLKRRQYTIEMFTFGVNATYARNVANAIKFISERDGRIPLKDISLPDQPVIDSMEVLSAHAARQPVPNPEPWQEHVWLTSMRVEDVYHASLA